MAKEKAHKVTRKIVSSKEIKNYKAEELVDTFKGKVVVFDAEKSEVAKELDIKEKGAFAIKLR
jgi:RNA polymerase subunit RPABC4/transcription elongation factor Spt4